MRKIIILLLTIVLLVPAVSAQEPPKYVALTFDDGPSGRFTTALLDGLNQRDVDATFFLCGYRLETYGNLAQAIRSGGHEIGLHGYSHDPMSQMSASAICDELERTKALLPDGCLVNLMRTPGGAQTDSVRQAAEEAGLAIVHWSVDPKDWATRDASLIQQRILDQVHDGDIILMHDMTDSSVQAALAVVDQLQAQGYQFLTVSQLAMLRLCHLESGQRYGSFAPRL